MAELVDGESFKVQGSAREPYVLKNTGGVYSCTCPAWRHQPRPIDRRTCKHLWQLRGEEAEAARLDSPDLPPVPVKPSRLKPELLLAEVWNPEEDPTDWWWSEKLDGVRAFWNGTHFYSRNGLVFSAPAWFTAGLPAMPLDGELWLGRRAFQRTVSIVRRHNAGESWRELRYWVFDAPQSPEPFETRQSLLRNVFDESRSYARLVAQERCLGVDHLVQELNRCESLGGEGLMLRRPGSRYEAGKSTTLLKVKRFKDADACVVEHLPGSGRHRGRLGALLVELPDGTRFAVGTGFTEEERKRPPSIGTLVTFRYQELTDGGVPRFPSFVRGRSDD